MNESFGQRLKRARTDAKVSQAQLAEACGWSQSRIGNYEVDKREPSLADIATMARALGVSDSELLLKAELGTYPFETSSEKVISDLLDEHCQNLPASVRSQILSAASASGHLFVGVSAEPVGKPRDDGLVVVPYYDSFGEDGHGQLPDGFVRTVHSLVVESSSLTLMGVHADQSSDLEIISAWNSDMEGTISRNDQVIVDRAVTSYNGDGIYLVTWLGQLYLRRVEKLSEGQYELIPDNQKHSRRTVNGADVIIHGKVSMALKATKV